MHIIQFLDLSTPHWEYRVEATAACTVVDRNMNRFMGFLNFLFFFKLNTLLGHWFINLSDNELIGYQTHQILNLSDTKLNGYQKYQIPNLLDIEHIRYQSYQILNVLVSEIYQIYNLSVQNLLDTEYINYWIRRGVAVITSW